MSDLQRVLEVQSGLVFWRNLPWMPEFGSDIPAVVVASLVKFGAVVLPAYLLFQYCERKLSADLQARVGPSRAGPHGLLQVLADFIKLIGKSRTVGEPQWTRRRSLLFAVLMMALFSSLSVLPIGGLVTHEGTELTLFLPFWLSAVCALLVVWIGLESNGVTGWLSALRMTSQFLAGLVPAFLAVLSVVVRSGSIQLSEVVSSQSSGVLHWGIFADPSQPVAFVVFLLGSVMMSGFAPMDAAFFMGDLSGGVASFATGRHQYLLRVARFYAMFFWAAFGVALFLGGWNLPGTMAAGLAGAEAFGLLAAVEVFVTMLKTFGLLIGMILVSRVVPKPRVDLISSISWKILTPLSLAVLMLGAIWKGMFLG